MCPGRFLLMVGDLVRRIFLPGGRKPKPEAPLLQEYKLSVALRLWLRCVQLLRPLLRLPWL